VFNGIKDSVEATLYMESLADGVKISDDDLCDWLHMQGYGVLTTRMSEKLWQSLPPKHKKPAGKKKNFCKNK